jgi:flagellar basal-body rod protein FlgB
MFQPNGSASAANFAKTGNRQVMNPVFLFNLASRQLQYLTARQAVISGNIANANTPGYRARDLTPFRDLVDKTMLTMAATRAGHLESEGPGARPTRATASGGWDVVHSGNSVSIEEQLMKSGEVSRDQALNGGVVKAFNRMLALSVKAGQ